jgi:maltose O-acetyltransferase
MTSPLDRFKRSPIQLLSRVADLARARKSFRGQILGRGVGAQGSIYVDCEGQIRIGDYVLFVSNGIASQFIVHPGASVEIGAHVVFNYGLSIEASHSIRIGEGCMFGSFVRISDKNCLREGPVVLKDKVWVAHGAIIEPGVTIGEGSVVSAGAVVTEDVPPNSMAIGNPARSMSLELRTGSAEDTKSQH